MRVLAVIQARCGSSRLPNKVLKDISGKPDLQWVVERVKRSTMVDEIIVATSIEKNNLPLIRLCTELQIRVFVGSEEDVLDRYYQCAKLLLPEYIVRITADCPLFDWRYLDMALREMDSSTDYMGEITETFPDGLDIEIMKFEALKRAWMDARLRSEREHVTLYFKNHPEIFKIQDLICPINDIQWHRWTLDEKADYDLIQNVYNHFISLGKEDFVTEDVLSYLNGKKEILSLNNSIKRNEGLAISLERDKILTEEEIG